MGIAEDFVFPILKIIGFFTVATFIHVPFYAGISYCFYLSFGYDVAAALAWVIAFPLLGASSFVLYKTKLGRWLADL